MTTTPSRDKLLKVFRDHDVDNSQALSKTEAIAALLSLFPYESPTKIVSRIKKLDRNNDGELSKLEFLQVGSKFYFSYGERIEAMFIKYDPERYTQAQIQEALEDEFEGDEEAFLDHLIDKAGEEPDRDEIEASGIKLAPGVKGEKKPRAAPAAPAAARRNSVETTPATSRENSSIVSASELHPAVRKQRTRPRSDDECSGSYVPSVVSSRKQSRSTSPSEVISSVANSLDCGPQDSSEERSLERKNQEARASSARKKVKRGFFGFRK